MKHIKIFTALCLMLLGFALSSVGQEIVKKTVTASVTDQSGAPVSGASVYGDNGSVMTFTDADGKFSIVVPDDSKLYVMANGFKSKTIDVLDEVPAIVMETGLDDIMVNVPLRTINSQDLSSTITVLKPADFIDNDYEASVYSAIDGRVSGLQWANNIWGLGGAMVIIDGVYRSLGDVQLDEVDQITVLKGVNAVALYGSEAAKGVLLITTKRGDANKRQINVRAGEEFGTPKAFPNYLNSAAYMPLYNEARANDGLDPLFDDETIANYTSGDKYRYPDVDYYSSEYLRKFVNSTYANLEFAGGNDNAKFYTNVGWNNSTSLLNIGEGVNEGSNRFNVRGNVDLKINNIFSSSIDISSVFTNSRNGKGNYWGQAASLHPYRFTPFVPLDMLGEEVHVPANATIVDGKYLLGGSQQYASTPFADLYAGGYTNYVGRKFQFSNIVNVNLNGLVDGLTFHTQLNVDYATGYTQSINNSYAVYYPTWNDETGGIDAITTFGNDSRSGTQNLGGSSHYNNLGFLSWFNYERSWNEVHNLSAVLLGRAVNVTTSGQFQPYTNSNLGLQLAYNYNHKYWADFSSAYVNSSKLPDGNRTAISPTLSLGWLVSEEAFLSGVSAIDYLKLSTSVGILNTDLDIPDYYLYDNVYSRSSYYSWGPEGQYQSQAFRSQYGGNPSLTFAKRKEFNASLDGAFFNKLLTLNATYFSYKMDGIVTKATAEYPSYYNDFVAYSNFNAYTRSGFEFLANINKKVGEVDITLGALATYVNSENTKVNEMNNFEYLNRAGKPTDAMFGLESDGLFSSSDEIASSPAQAFGKVQAGDVKYKDQNGDNIIDEKDEVMIGRWNSPLVYAANLTATYKSFTLYVEARGNMGGTGLKSGNYYWVDGDDKYSDVVLDRWTEATKATATYPRLSAQSNSNNFRTSDFWTYKSDQINLSKVQLTYNLPKNVVSKAFVRDMKVYVTGSNLITVAKNKDVLQLNVGGQPQLRYFSVGVNAKF